MSKRLIIALLFLVLVPALAAQRGGFGGGFHGGFHNSGGVAGNRGGRFGRGAAYWGDPYFYADYPVQSLAYETPAPPVVIVQQTAAAAPAEPERDPESVMIEWQGDRYVRSAGQQSSDQQDYAEAPASVSGNAVLDSRTAPQASSELPPAVLVYRDGHRENVADYVIARGNLYTRGNYWRDGYWTRTVQLAALDIPATMKANQQSGVKFVLPSSPNEVVTRP
jgi:hypothetical protein